MPKDVNPQLYRFSITESVVNTFTEEEKPIPVHMDPTNSLVMEIFKIYLDIAIDALAEDGIVLFHLATNERGSLDSWNQSGVFCSASVKTNLITSGGVLSQMPLEIDYSDGKGNGLLIATDRVFAGIQGIGQIAARSVNGAILYKLKKVSSVEYVGIVQSQISG